ncbi:MAG: GxxExxY protein [Flavobacteriales bacterium]
MAELVYKQEVYDIVGACMEVHKQLGHGFLEAVYGDALVIEFEQRKISYNREVKFDIDYKGQTLTHKYVADFIVFNKIVLEIKAAAFIVDEHIAQCLNYVKASGLRLGVIVNFGREKMEYKRLIY